MGILLAWLARLYTGSTHKRSVRFSNARGTSYVWMVKWIVSSASLMLAACSTDPQLTPDSQILINPGSFEFEVEEFKNPDGTCIFSPDFFQDVPVSLAIVDGSNRAIGDAQVTVYLDFAANTFSGRETLQLFFDSNGNGVVDTPDEFVSGIGDDVFRVRTDEFTASTLLLLRINLSCGFRGSLYAFSGPAAATIQIEVIATQVEEEIDELTGEN